MQPESAVAGVCLGLAIGHMTGVLHQYLATRRDLAFAEQNRVFVSGLLDQGPTFTELDPMTVYPVWQCNELVEVHVLDCKCDPPGSGEEFCTGACEACHAG